MKGLIFHAAGIVTALAGTALLLAGLLFVIAALGHVQRYIIGAVLSTTGFGLMITGAVIFRKGNRGDPTVNRT